MTMPGERTFSQRKLAENNPLKRLQPGFYSSQTFTLLFETALGRALDEVENWQRDRDDFHPLLISIGEQCFKSGIPEEEAVRQVMMHYRQHFRSTGLPLVSTRSERLLGMAVNEYTVLKGKLSLA